MNDMSNVLCCLCLIFRPGILVHNNNNNNIIIIITITIVVYLYAESDKQAQHMSAS
jgi:hypothetical protein